MSSRAVAICDAGELDRWRLGGVLRSEHADIVHVYDIRDDVLVALNGLPYVQPSFGRLGLRITYFELSRLG